MQAPPLEDRKAGWFVIRDGRRYRLERLWWPSGIREPIREDHYTQATAEFPFTRFCCGRSDKGTRLLALVILLGRFDWPIAWTFHEYFAVDFLIPLRLSRHSERFISKEDVNAWWSVKEDVLLGLLEAAEVTTSGGRA